MDREKHNSKDSKMKKTKIIAETDTVEEFFSDIREHAKNLDDGGKLPRKNASAFSKTPVSNSPRPSSNHCLKMN